MSEAVVQTKGLTKLYGRRHGLDGLDLEVRPGEVFGFLGPNGAGKSTTIRILLDLIRPSGGEARVFGVDPRRAGAGLRRRIGYLAGDFVVEGRQSGRDLLIHLASLRGGLPKARIAALADRLDLDLSVPIRNLSKGNRQKVGLIQAFMHEPELLILDEPTTGLDPLLQQEFLAMVAQVRTAGQTVFMSSHVMSEVQQVADRAGIIRAGRLIAVEEVDSLREHAMRHVEIYFAGTVPAADFTGLDHVHDVTISESPDGTLLRCRVDGRADALIKAAARYPVISLLSEEPDLEQLFFTHYRQPEEASSVA